MGAGRAVTALKSQISDLKRELDTLIKPKEMPELIESANLLRINEYLKESDRIKTRLVELYDQYAASLENLLSDVFEIQFALKDLIKEEAQSLSSQNTKSSKREKTKKRGKKKKSNTRTTKKHPSKNLTRKTRRKRM